MNRFFKIGFFIGITLLLIGGLLMIFSRHIKNIRVGNIIISSAVYEDSGLQLVEGNKKFEDITGIAMKVSKVNVTFEQGDEFKVEYGTYRDMLYTLEEKDNVLYIDYKHSNLTNLKYYDEQYIKIIYPKDTTFDFCNIEAFTSSISMDKMNLDSAYISAYTCNIDTEELKVNNVDIITDASVINMKLNGKTDDYKYAMTQNSSICKINGKSLKDYIDKSGNNDKKINIDASSSKINFMME